MYCDTVIFINPLGRLCTFTCKMYVVYSICMLNTVKDRDKGVACIAVEIHKYTVTASVLYMHMYIHAYTCLK